MAPLWLLWLCVQVNNIQASPDAVHLKQPHLSFIELQRVLQHAHQLDCSFKLVLQTLTLAGDLQWLPPADYTV